MKASSASTVSNSRSTSPRRPSTMPFGDRSRRLAIKTSITSNGLSIQALPDEGVKRFHSVEFSLDFPTQAEHDAFRGPISATGYQDEHHLQRSEHSGASR